MTLGSSYDYFDPSEYMINMAKYMRWISSKTLQYAHAFVLQSF